MAIMERMVNRAESQLKFEKLRATRLHPNFPKGSSSARTQYCVSTQMEMGEKTESSLVQVAAAVRCCSLGRRQTRERVDRERVDREQSSICGDNGSQCGCWSVKQSGLVVFISADMGQRKDAMDGVPGRGSGRA